MTAPPFVIRQTTHPATGLPALIYEATPPTAPMLQQAREILEQLPEQSLSTLPVILEFGETKEGRVWLALKQPDGKLLRDRILFQDQGLLTEPELLDLMHHQLETLAQVHEAGFSGLRPTWDDIWWDEATGRWTILGWEWLVEGDEAIPGDLRAAASTWIELALGAPPSPTLLITEGPQAWRAFSTGLRHILITLWEERTAYNAFKLMNKQPDYIKPGMTLIPSYCSRKRIKSYKKIPSRR